MTNKTACLILSSLTLFCNPSYNNLPKKENTSLQEEIKIPSKSGWRLFVYNEDNTLAGINKYPLYKPEKDNLKELNTFIMSGIGRVVHPGTVDVYDDLGELIGNYNNNPGASKLLQKVTESYSNDVTQYFKKRDECYRLRNDDYKYEKCLKEELPGTLPKNLDEIVFVNYGDKLPELKPGDHRFVCACAEPKDEVKEYEANDWSNECKETIYCLLE